jgi:hypothetical protein
MFEDFLELLILVLLQLEECHCKWEVVGGVVFVAPVVWAILPLVRAVMFATWEIVLLFSVFHGALIS